ncbi:MAG: tRNA (adenosine(37)-N6)-threonylcarbamoyltransferase complex transferase subunit TsaD [Bacteroidales bacterium]
MLMLGIETSCDETAAAIVEETDDAQRPWRIRSSVVASQVEIHREWGGVVPELASRQHLRDICGVVERALQQAAVPLDSIDAVAVTEGPGLVGSLLVGVAFAKSLAHARGLPLVPVHHLAGHIESLFLEHGPLPLPAVVLVVSGGHTSLYQVPQEGVYRLIGRTRDDAAGEAYDKVAKLLGLGYPGGPIIDKLAKEGNDRAIDFPMSRMTHPDRVAPGKTVRFEFSFSGIKTSVLRYVRGQRIDLEAPRGTRGALPVQAREFADQEIKDIAASFQRTVVSALVDRTFDAARWAGARSVGIAGGVSANSRLRRDAALRGQETGLPVFVPSLHLSTDNAAMIAAAGLRRFHQGVRAELTLNADPALGL